MDEKRHIILHWFKHNTPVFISHGDEVDKEIRYNTTAGKIQITHAGFWGGERIFKFSNLNADNILSCK